MKRLLLLLLLLPSASFGQLPGIMASQWTGVSVRDSLSVELYAENYVKGSAAVSAKWYDAQNPAVFASQSSVDRMPSLVGNGLNFSLTNYLLIASLPASLSSNNNSAIFIFKPRDNSGSRIAGTGPVSLCSGVNYAAFDAFSATLAKEYCYSGTALYSAETIATTSLRFVYSSLGTAGRLRINSGSIASGTTGTTLLPVNSLVIGKPYAGAYYLDGVVYSVLIYGRQLSNAEVTTVFNELAAHYGLTIP